MKRYLSLVRHAKSSWELPIADQLRPLNSLGVHRALTMKKIIQDSICKSDYIVTSPAVRAQTTAYLLTENLDLKAKTVSIDQDLYTFELKKLETFVKKMNPTLTHIFVFGHNNAITDFVNKFGDLRIDNVPTCGWVTILFDAPSWKEIQQGKTIRFITPKDLNYDCK